MRKILFAVIVSSTCLLIAIPTFASPGRRLATFLNEELFQINSALEATPTSPESNSGAHAWNVRNFYLRLQATVGFALPQFLSVDIVPQVELVFHKKTPAEQP